MGAPWTCCPAEQVAVVRRDELGLCGRFDAGGLQGARTVGRYLPIAEPHRTVVALELVARVRAGHGGCVATGGGERMRA